MILLVLLLAPLICALVAAFLRKQAQLASVVTIFGVLVATALSWFIFLQNSSPVLVEGSFTWIKMGSLVVDWSLYADKLVKIMLITVTSVSALVHIYSVGYMRGDPGQGRFMAKLSFFTFSMLFLVMSGNLVQMFVGWEAVGLASYLLIGFWFKRPSANAAAMKAFLVNRVADAFFLMGICLLGVFAGTWSFDAMFAQLPNIDPFWLEIIAIMLILGAMGKSAQIGFHVWLPDAMEGPTPVSALIHAATMVTAGIVLLVRCAPVLEISQYAGVIVTLVGGLTAFYAGFIALVQNDIKRIIAYSTCSQLGIMFVAIGIGAYSGAIFHLFTHAFFKALLFLGAGGVIVSVGHQQDITRMGGGMFNYIPVQGVLMWIGALSLMGAPFMSGYFSKDFIVEAAYLNSALGGGGLDGAVGYVGVILILVASVFTSIYTLRMLWVVFHRQQDVVDVVSDREIMAVPSMMLLPQLPLAVGAVIAGWAAYAWVGIDWHISWAGVDLGLGNDLATLPMANLDKVPWWVKYAPMGALLGGLAVFLFLLGKLDDLGMPRKLSKWIRAAFYWDVLYERVLITPYMWISHKSSLLIEHLLIDTWAVMGTARSCKTVGQYLASLHGGNLSKYLLFMFGALLLVTMVCVLTWMFGAVSLVR